MRAIGRRLGKVADERAKVLDFIYWQARRKGRSAKFLIGPDRRVNQAAVCRAMGIHGSQLSRLLDGGPEIGRKFERGLAAFAELPLEDLWEQVLSSQPAPPGAYGTRYP